MQNQGNALPTDRASVVRAALDAGRITFTVAEVAQLLGKNRNTVYRMVERGEQGRDGGLPSTRLGGDIHIPMYALASLFPPSLRQLIEQSAPVEAMGVAS